MNARDITLAKVTQEIYFRGGAGEKGKNDLRVFIHFSS